MLDPRVERNIMPEPNSGCWLWTGTVTTHGYGQFAYYGIKHRSAHRYVYEQINGRVPDGLVLDHKCRVRSCVNPDHLEPVTYAENTRRGVLAEANRRRFSALTHCKQGHPFSGENLYMQPNGKRACHTCRDKWRNEWLSRNPRAASPARLAIDINTTAV
jgi:hypothetical protein